MTKTLRLRALFFTLCCGAPLAASCAQDSTPELGGSAGVGAKASAGNKATGGNGFSGSSAVAGSVGNPFGGTSNQGGKASGGASNGGSTGPDLEAGAPSSGGTTNASGSGGGGGTSSVPPDVLERASAIVYYRTSETTADSKKIAMKLNIVNQSPDPLPLAHVKIRYWATAEKSPDLHNYYVVESFKPVKSEYIDAGDDSHALMSFVGAPGSVSMSETDINRSEIQLELSTNSGAFDQSDDYSWDPTATSTPKPNPKITLYLDDELIWGCEPSGKCFDDAGTGGAGGEGGGGAGASAGSGGSGGTGGAGGTGAMGGTAGVGGDGSEAGVAGVASP